ncbi:thioredoxin-dependent thiol peroxidase [Lacihabitans sp. LS3-19]|uniref:thioredoxin-dependent thiol peroxidase n=1 Tax=Lacihabitans sp. LS3-19 TaxID=2487335 RepID=UPI0020CEB41B|nr:thioredoxin-dependent thiol peroxidase [Lacihabitans sp. LS3-19]MCP9770265.1 thioredoxin-dependent thiol peroxidase [Lacihabitans sp. LS3-19]
MILEIGQKAPNFETINQNGETVKLSDFAEKKVVLYFYPKDNTPTCTTQACNLRDNYQSLMAKGYTVLGVSIDNAKSHLKFKTKFELPFDLLDDSSQKMVNDYGVWVEKMMYGKKYMGTARTTFIIDENGNISDIIEKVESKRHSEQIA